MRNDQNDSVAVIEAATTLADVAAGDVYTHINSGTRGSKLYAAALCAGVAGDQALEYERLLGHKVGESIRVACLQAAVDAGRAYDAGMRLV